MSHNKIVLDVELVAKSFESPKGRLERPWKTTIDADDPKANFYRTNPAFKVKQRQVPAPEPAPTKKPKGGGAPPATPPEKVPTDPGPNDGKGQGAGNGSGDTKTDTPLDPETPISDLGLDLQPLALEELAKSGYVTAGDLEDASAEDLQAIKGVGEATLKKLLDVKAKLLASE